MITVGLVTIGQSPRPDVLASMFGDRHSVPCLEAGALDQIDRDELVRLRPEAGEHPLVTRLRDGSEFVIAKQRLIPYLQRAVTRAVAQGASLIVVLCTGAFPRLEAGVPVIYPDRLLTQTVDAVLPSGTIGVMMPHTGQLDSMREKWRRPGRAFTGVAVSPYDAGASLGAAARELVASGADLIVMDCMGFTAAMKRAVVREAGVPAVLANRLVGRVVEELVTG